MFVQAQSIGVLSLQGLQPVQCGHIFLNIRPYFRPNAIEPDLPPWQQQELDTIITIHIAHHLFTDETKSPLLLPSR